ncbi:hypothetical protein H6F44_11790, partial [Pseudanabaena sp. FACHB-1277]
MKPMSKLLIAAMGLMLGFGSIIGYYLARWDLQSNAIANSQQAIAQPEKPNPEVKPESRKEKQIDIRTIKPVKTARELLEEKYRLCVGNNGDISKVPDSVMTQVIKKMGLKPRASSTALLNLCYSIQYKILQIYAST